MNDEILRSRRRVSRRRALALGGTVGLSGLIAACAGDTSTTASTSTAASVATSGSTSASADALSDLLETAPRCVMSKEETEGPYWFDVDSIRSDIREDRPGAQFDLALRVQDLGTCSADGAQAPVSNAVVEIWHCDAGGVYSGFESGSASAGGGGGGGGQPPSGGQGGPPPGGEPPSGGAPGGQPPSGGGSQQDGQQSGSGQDSSTETSDGSYSVGDRESTPTDDGTYLRGAQTTDSGGVARFTTIFPGWYQGRTSHIHVKVHVDKKTVLTTQIYFDDATKTTIYATEPYSDHAGWEQNTQNSTDSIFDETGMVAIGRNGSAWLGAINLGVEV